MSQNTPTKPKISSQEHWQKIRERERYRAEVEIRRNAKNAPTNPNNPSRW